MTGRGLPVEQPRVIERRRLLIALGAGALAAPFASLAQQPGKVWRVGILPGGPLAPRGFQWDAFRQRLSDLGYVESRNIEYAIGVMTNADYSVLRRFF